MQRTGGRVYAASQCFGCFKNCFRVSTICRVETAPRTKSEKFSTLIQAAKSVDIDIQVNTSKALAVSLDKAVLPGKPFFNKLIRIMTTRCMSQAVYFSSGESQQKSTNIMA